MRFFQKRGWWAVSLLALTAVACNNESISSLDNVVSGTKFADFRSAAALQAGPDATDCGHVRFNDDHSAANCCVAAEHGQFIPYYVSYDMHPLDERESYALARDKRGVVWQIDYTADRLGQGRTDNGRVVVSQCRMAELNANACSEPDSIPLSCTLRNQDNG